MTYSLPGKPELSDLITEILEHLVYGWYPVYEEDVVYTSGTLVYDLNAGGVTTKDIHDIIDVWGILDGTKYTFVHTTDYVLQDSTGDGNNDRFLWINTGDAPDDGTTFYVSYRYQVSSTGLTDINPGSVLLTTVEALAIQLYRAFLKMEEVGRDSFVDTAIGRNLDLLGRIVGITRNEATRATGYITLQRDPSSTTSVIDIPIGSQLATVTTSTTPAIYFQTTKAARIRSGETYAVTYTSTDDPDHLQRWVAVEAIEQGDAGNVSAGTVIRNTNAPPLIIYVYNSGTYDAVGEQHDGDGSSKVYELAHSPAVVTSLGTKYIQYKYGFIDQPSSSTTVRLDLTTGSGGYTGGVTVTCTVYGVDSGGSAASEAESLSDTVTNATTTTSFQRIDYVTFANSDDTTKGIGEDSGLGYKITIKNGAQTETYLDDEAAGTRVDSGWLDMVGDEDNIWVYIWQDSSWTLKTRGTAGAGSNQYGYEDSGSDAGLIEWGATWTETTPYITKYDAGPNSDGQNLRLEYYPIAGEEGTGDSTPQETGISAFAITEEYKRGWMDQPSSAGSNISVSFTNGATVDQDYDGTVVIHGTTTTGGEEDQEALVFGTGSTDYESTTTKKFSKILYVTWANADNPTYGPGEGSQSSTYARLGTTTKAEDLMEESKCGTRVDSGILSLVGVDSDTTLKVYVWDSGWSIRTQSSTHYTYTDTGTDAGIVDWGSVWDFDNAPYKNEYDAGPNEDGRNIKIEYVPAYGQYLTEGNQLKLEGAPTTGSLLTLSYTWSNDYITGADTEKDDPYRIRIRTSIASSAKGTLAAIASSVLAVDGIEGVVVDDHSTDPTIDIGEVHIFAWTRTGLLDAGTRSLVSDAVEDTRAAGVKPVVSSPTPIYLAIEMTVRVEKTAVSSLSTVETDVESAISIFVSNLGINTLMYKSDLIRAVEAITDVKYVKLDTIVVKGYDTSTSTDVSQESPYSSSPYWWFDETAGGGDPWSDDGNTIFLNTGYVFRPDTDSTGTEIDVTAEYD